MNLRLKRTPGLYLVGFMGSGKTTIGRLLAERLGWNFFDSDEEIEAAENAAIADIFSARGEPDFRRIETRVIGRHVRAIECGRPTVLALGGGAFSEARNRELLADHGLTVWLHCPFEVVQRRVAGLSHRPLARDPERFTALYQARLPDYALADLRIVIESDDPADAVAAILAHPLFP